MILFFFSKEAFEIFGQQSLSSITKIYLVFSLFLKLTFQSFEKNCKILKQRPVFLRNLCLFSYMFSASTPVFLSVQIRCVICWINLLQSQGSEWIYYTMLLCKRTIKAWLLSFSSIFSQAALRVEFVLPWFVNKTTLTWSSAYLQILIFKFTLAHL